MKRTLSIFSICFFLPLTMFAQAIAKKVMEFKIPREGGANGAAVVWHPVQKKYYVAMAGNVSYPFAVYDETGKLLSPPELQTYFDVRGMWYNPGTKTLQVNGYNDAGWAEYVFDRKGFPSEVKILHKGKIQPDVQSTPAFNPADQTLYFLTTEGYLEKYEVTDAIFKEIIQLRLAKTENAQAGDYGNNMSEYNKTTVIYTGNPGAEIGLLNHVRSRIELYNIKTGFMSRYISIPETGLGKENLNFAYSNGIYWLFDKEKRVWKGYK